MIVGDIIKIIEEFAPISIQEEWDNSGLCIGSPNDDVHGVLIGFDCTPDLVDEAIEVGANMIITHHPLIFKGIKQISPDNLVGQTIIKAISAGIAVYATHTASDKVINGVSGLMADKLSLQNRKILDYEGTYCGISDDKSADNLENKESKERPIGLGIIGDLPEPMEVNDVIKLVKEKFSLKVLKSSKIINNKIRKIALCGGSGASLIDKAYKQGADLYISGDISYHNFFLPEGFMIMDIGHFESEVGIVNALYSLIKKNFPNFVVYTQKNINNSNPIYYF